MVYKGLVGGLLLIILLLRYLTGLPNFVNGQYLKVSGRVYSQPVDYFGKTRFVLSGIKISVLGDEGIDYGDFVSVAGVYRDGKIEDAKVVELRHSLGFFAALRNRLVNFYRSSLPEPHASLVAGITIGARSNLNRGLAERLRRSGTSHIVVASGTNVAIVGGFVMSVSVSLFSRRRAVILTIISIWFYAFIAGVEAPILRAAVMSTFAFIAQGFGRVVNAFRITLITGYIMLFFAPSFLTDLSFLLSFATTLSLIFLTDKFNSLFGFVPGIFRDDVSTSLAAFLGSSPIIFYFFGNISLIGPFINVLVLWTVVPIMMIGGIGALLSFIFPHLGKLLLQAVLPLTSWFLAVINF